MVRVKLAKALVLIGKVSGTRDAKRLIGTGKVKVRGVVATSSSIKVDRDALDEEVEVIDDNEGQGCAEEGDPKRQKVEGRSRFCIAYNKPCGMECTMARVGDEGIKTLLDIVPALPIHYQAVGRLDRHR